jgi:hypothetical protein
MNETERSYSGTVIAVILLMVMIAGVGYRYWPSDERSIRRHLSNLAEALSFPLAESDEERITRIEVLREYFAPEARVHVDGRELSSRDEIIHLLTRFQPPPGGVNVEFVNIAVVLDAEHERANVSLTAKWSMADERGASSVEERAADVVMRKDDGDWVIATATTRPGSATLWKWQLPRRVGGDVGPQLRDAIAYASSPHVDSGPLAAVSRLTLARAASYRRPAAYVRPAGWPISVQHRRLCRSRWSGPCCASER